MRGRRLSWECRAAAAGGVPFLSSFGRLCGGGQPSGSEEGRPGPSLRWLAGGDLVFGLGWWGVSPVSSGYFLGNGGAAAPVLVGLPEGSRSSGSEFGVASSVSVWRAGLWPQFWFACLRGPGPWAGPSLRAQRFGQWPQFQSAFRRGSFPQAQRAGQCPMWRWAWQRGPVPWAQRAGRRPLRQQVRWRRPIHGAQGGGP